MLTKIVVDTFPAPPAWFVLTNPLSLFFGVPRSQFQPPGRLGDGRFAAPEDVGEPGQRHLFIGPELAEFRVLVWLDDWRSHGISSNCCTRSGLRQYGLNHSRSRYLFWLSPLLFWLL